MSQQKDQLSVQPLAGYPQEIASALWRMQNARKRTLNALKDLPETAVDFQAAGLQNSIGTLLYHIAAIEMDWLFEEVLQQPWTAEIEALFPHPVRDQDGRLHPVLNVSLNDHLARLETSRQCLLDGFSKITLDDFHRLREMERYEVSPEWVLHHLAQHEAEHRGEILTIKTLYTAKP